MRCGTLFFFLQEIKQLVVNEYKVKLNLDGSLARLKARLVDKRYSQMSGINYHETSRAAKLTYVRILISFVCYYPSLVVTSTWYQECIPSWYSWWRGLYRVTTRFCWSRGVWTSLLSQNLYIGWSNLLKYGLRDLPRLFRSLSFVVLRRIILFSFSSIWINKFFCLFMRMI